MIGPVVNLAIRLVFIYFAAREFNASAYGAALIVAAVFNLSLFIVFSVT